MKQKYIYFFILMFYSCTNDCFLSLTGSLGQIVVTQPEFKSVQLGQTVSIDCKVNTVVYRYPTGSVSKDYYIFWYIQKPEEPPKLLIYYTTMKPSSAPSRMSGGGSFHSGGNGLDFSLTISDAQLEDAGDYYCQSLHKIGDKWVFTQLKNPAQKPPSVRPQRIL